MDAPRGVAGAGRGPRRTRVRRLFDPVAHVLSSGTVAGRPGRPDRSGGRRLDHSSEGVALNSEALPHGGAGPYQLQAAIAAIHDEAPSAEATDWPQLMALYEWLMRTSDNPVVH